jgi:hypothetical protein
MTDKIQSKAPPSSLYQEIQAVYNSEIASNLGELRKKAFIQTIIQYLHYAWILILLFIGFVLIPIGLIWSSVVENHSLSLGLSKNPHYVWFLVGGIIVCILALCADASGSKKATPYDCFFGFQKSYAKVVIMPLLKHVNLSLTLDYDAEFPQGIYKKSNLFPRKYDRYTSKTVLINKLNRDFIIGYVCSEYYEADGDGGSYETIFSGLMARLPFPKATSGQTFILPDESEKLLGGFAKQVQGMTNHAGAKLVTMDNPDFEKAFQVYTTDSVQAHYLLSTKWLEKLTDFQRELKVPISIALHSGMCYVVLHGYESPFTPQQDLEKALTASGVYSQYIRLKKLFDQLEVLQQIGSTLTDD